VCLLFFASDTSEKKLVYANCIYEIIVQIMLRVSAILQIDCMII